MASNLGCIGLQPASEGSLLEVLNQVESQMRPMGRTSDGAQVLQWTDESGARLTLTVAGDDIVDLVPSFAGRTGPSLARLRHQDDFVAADVLDDDGAVAAQLLCDLEQRPFLGEEGAFGAAALTAFGLDVSVQGGRTGESFRSLGLFEGGDAEPYARVSAHVVESQTRTNTRTGQDFHAVQVRCHGMDLVLCLAAADHPTPPALGDTVSGVVYVVASLPSLWPTAAARRHQRH